jgi:hypothetical protein
MNRSPLLGGHEALRIAEDLGRWFVGADPESVYVADLMASDYIGS